MDSEITNIVVTSFGSYNRRRYSRPWVCKMSDDGQYDFSCRVGCYTGQEGEEGEVVVFHPVEGQVYAYGRKDHRGNNTVIKYVKWTGNGFVGCNKLGKVIS